MRKKTIEAANTESLLSLMNVAQPKMIWNGPSANVHIIDDMIYDGLQYDSSQSHCTFSEVMDEYEHCITLMGPSKNGLASLRAGLIIAPSRIMSDLRNMDRDSNYVASDMTLNILSLFFNNSAEREQKRLAYQKRAISHYRFAGHFMKALINGIDSVQADLSKSDAVRMRDILRSTQNLTAKEATSALKSGINGLKISTTPQAGFFHLLDFSGLKGMKFPVQKNWGAKYTVLQSEHDFTDLCHEMNLGLATGSYMGTPIELCVQRLTYASPLPEIVNATERLRLVANACNPQYI
jgi:aspartate/methionine/tyrosine aminotransferase